MLSNAPRHLHSLWLRVADLLAPQDCFVCGAESGGEAVCATCTDSLPRRPDSACRRCGLPGLGGGPCLACQRDPPAYDATVAVFEFTFPVDVMVHALKYRHQLAMAHFLGAALAARGMDFGHDADLVLPMPLHPHSLAERGFNQAVELARPLAREQALPMELACVRKLRDTPPQASLSRDERLLSPAGAFRCDRALDGLHVLVVDDVMTTGATLDELARCLKAQGAARVTNLVVARTPAPA